MAFGCPGRLCFAQPWLMHPAMTIQPLTVGPHAGTCTYTWADDSFVINIGAVSAVPEPWTLALFGTALVALFMLRGRIEKDAKAA